MNAVEGARERLRGRRKAPAPEPWRPPELGDFFQAQRVLAHDATLSHCGIVGFTVWADWIEVWCKRTIHPKTQRQSYLETWDKAAELDRELRLLHRDIGYGAWSVIEAPSVGGGHRTESSLFAGFLVTQACPDNSWTAVSATRVSAVMLGDSRIRSEDRKKAIAAAVARLLPETATRGWNEHERDALATGLTWTYDERIRRPQRPYRTGAQR